MKEKLVEEWLIRARERGGIDQSFAQWLISQGHEILWLGHRGTEFGKDIISRDATGQLHAFQTKDEDIDLDKLRQFHAQITELVEVPVVHPRVPAGSSHSAHFVTSGLFTLEATARIRAMNEGWTAKKHCTVEIVSRNDLIPRLVRMSDAFWPERPADIRDFFSFYLAEGRGDFDSEKFGAVLRGLLPLVDESGKRKGQRLAAVGLLANYLLNPFEREADHWSLFRGWVMVAAHQAWFANASKLPKTLWESSFNLAKDAAKERVIALSLESVEQRAFEPRDKEFDDYTRTRNLIAASALATAGLIDSSARVDKEKITARIEMLLNNGRFFLWGESAIPHVITIQWYAEKNAMAVNALPLVKAIIAAICERDRIDSNDEYFPPPRISPDEVLAELFKDEPRKEPNRRCPGSWGLEALVDFLARRDDKDFLERIWRDASHVDIMSFQPEQPADVLLWKSSDGHESARKLAMEQSWAALKQIAQHPDFNSLPDIVKEDREFALLFLLAYPHRLSPALLGFLDQNYSNLNAA